MKLKYTIIQPHGKAQYTSTWSRMGYKKKSTNGHILYTLRKSAYQQNLKPIFSELTFHFLNSKTQEFYYKIC